MSYTIHQELRAYYEILEIAENEITELLWSDHPPQDVCATIAQKSTVVDDIKWLIRDIKVQIALDSFQELTF